MIFHRYSNSFIMMLNNRHSNVWDQDESSVSQRSHGEYKGNHSRLSPRQIGHSITPNIAVAIFRESETRVDSDAEFQGRGTILNLRKSEESSDITWGNRVFFGQLGMVPDVLLIWMSCWFDRDQGISLGYTQSTFCTKFFELTHTQKSVCVFFLEFVWKN